MIVSCPGRSVSWLCVPVTTVLSDRETFVSCMFLYKIKCKMRLVYSFFSVCIVVPTQCILQGLTAMAMYRVK